jgi:hypothetical protein
MYLKFVRIFMYLHYLFSFQNCSLFGKLRVRRLERHLNKCSNLFEIQFVATVFCPVKKSYKRYDIKHQLKNFTAKQSIPV